MDPRTVPAATVDDPLMTHAKASAAQKFTRETRSAERTYGRCASRPRRVRGRKADMYMRILTRSAAIIGTVVLGVATSMAQPPVRIDPFKDQVAILIQGLGGAVPDFSNRLRCDYEGENIEMRAVVGGQQRVVTEAVYGAIVPPEATPRKIRLISSASTVFEIRVTVNAEEYALQPDPCDYAGYTATTSDDCADRALPSALFGESLEISHEGLTGRLIVRSGDTWETADPNEPLTLQPPSTTTCP